jgi:hypothetical protein
MFLALFSTCIKSESMIRCINRRLLHFYVMFNLLNTKIARGKLVNGSKG